jgi:hypothetical protein
MERPTAASSHHSHNDTSGAVHVRGEPASTAFFCDKLTLFREFIAAAAARRVHVSRESNIAVGVAHSSAGARAQLRLCGSPTSSACGVSIQ